MKEFYLDAEILQSFPSLNSSILNQEFSEAQKNFYHKVIVLDDDPTGTQTVHDVPVYTDWTTDTL